jgi:CARDB protein
MATMPQGAQLSEDGQWWWDGAQWQQVDGGTGGDGGGGQQQGEAHFAFGDQGLLVSPDDSDNPENHAVLHHEAGNMVSFAIFNTGNAAASATVTVYVDDQEVQSWTSGEIAPGGSAVPNDGFVRGCGRYAAGSHTFRVLVQPGQAGYDSTTNTVDID